MTSNASLAQMSILWICFWDEEVKAASKISQNWLYSLSFKATNDLGKWRGNDEEKSVYWEFYWIDNFKWQERICKRQKAMLRLSLRAIVDIGAADN